jgi:hypothetical protein
MKTDFQVSILVQFRLRRRLYQFRSFRSARRGLPSPWGIGLLYSIDKLYGSAILYRPTFWYGMHVPGRYFLVR